MKRFATIFICLSFTAILAGSCNKESAPSASSLQDIGDVASMQRRSDGRFDVQCRDGSTETATEADILANTVCERTTPGSGDFLYGRSDSCSQSDIVGEVRANSSCTEFSTSQIVWSVKVNGRCRDISDTNANAACLQIQAESHDVVYGRSDSCSSDSVAAILTDATECEQLSATDIAWSIKVDGQCRDISDTNVRAACFQIKGQTAPGIIYARSDSCSSDQLLGTVHTGTDCRSFDTTSSAWSIKVNNQCSDISDTNPQQACYQIKERLGSNFIYGRSDSCSRDTIVAEVDRWTDCLSLSNSDIAWSINVEGQCRDISDTNVRSACFAIKQQIGVQ